MGTENIGNQKITFDIHKTRGDDYNTLLRGVVKPGIYSGGDILITGSDTILLSWLVSYINFDTDKIVRVETTEPSAFTVDEAYPAMTITYNYVNTKNNYADFHFRSSGYTLDEYELHIGRCVFLSGNLNSIDYTERSYGNKLTSDVPNGISPLKVTSETKVDHLNADKIDGCDVESELTFSSNKIPRSDAIINYVVPKTVYISQQTLTCSASMNIDWTINTKAKITLSTNTQFTFTPPTDKTTLLLMLVQDNPGSRTVTWPSGIKWADRTVPTLSTSANYIDIITFYWDGTYYYGMIANNFG